MNKIDTDSWKDFKIGELFDIHPTKAYKLTNNNLFENDGTNPVIVNSSYNNGVGGYTSLKTTEEGNIITFSDTTSSDAIFFQEADFVGYPHVQGMYPTGKYKNDWGKYSLLFFVSVFKSRANCLNYDYVNKFTRDSAKQITIKLPVDRTGNPHFSYMEAYMKNMEASVDSSLTAFQSAKLLENSKISLLGWKEFVLSDILEMQKQTEINPIQAYYDDGDGEKYPFYGQSKANNGIISYISLDEKYLNNESSSCSILIHSNTHECVLATTPFYLKDGHGATSIFTNHSLNEFSALYIMSVLSNVMSEKFNYDIKATKEALKKLKLILPADKNGNPDYKYMECYMKNVEKKVKKNIELFNAI